MKDLNRREAKMLHIYSKLGEVHTEDFKELLLPLTMDDMLGAREDENKLTLLDATCLRETLRESAEEIFHTFLGITKWDFDKLKFEKALELYEKKNMENAYSAIMCELFKDREQKDWHSVTLQDIREAKDKALILFMKDFFKTGNIETKEDEQTFIDQLKALETKPSKREAKRIQAFVTLFEKYRKDGENNE